MSAPVFVCLNCERHEEQDFTCDEQPGCERPQTVSMSPLLLELRNVEAALQGIPCMAKRNGGRRCTKNGSGFQCSSCGGLRSARRALDEALKAEPIPELRRAS